MLVGRNPAELEAFLRENLGFDDDTLPRPLSSLSGGWRMKLVLARCGGKVLLHNTHIFLHLGKKYGLLGHNGAGKMTLLRNITNDKIEGMPAELVYVFLESHVDDEQSITTAMLGVILTDPMLVGRDPAELETILHENLGFNDDKLLIPMSSLRGGWRIKLALARCCLIAPVIMLLDEPTNHLDHRTVEWFIDRLRKKTHATVLAVSHDAVFLAAICTDITHHEK